MSAEADFNFLASWLQLSVEKYMTALSAVRSRKEIANSLVCLPGCRAALCLLATPLFALAWQSATPPIPACQAAGQVAGWDIDGRTLSLKSDSGEYSDFHYDRSTTFRTADATFQPDEPGLLERLSIDDRVCVEAFRADNKQIASRVRVTYRAEIDARDKRELVRWQSEALFGAVKALDPANHRITVRVSNIEAFMLITGFSPGGVLQPGPGQSVDWVFQAIGFGGSRP